MPQVNLSFVIATIGRPTLPRLLESIVTEMEPGDEILLVTDMTRRLPPERDFGAGLDARLRYIHCDQGGDWGHTEHRVGLPFAIGTHILVPDDDDRYLPGGVTAIRNSCAAHPNRPIMFRMVEPAGLLLWTDKEVRVSNHGGPQFVVPNTPGKVPPWPTGRRESDYDFVVATLALYPLGALVWDPAVVYACHDWEMWPVRLNKGEGASEPKWEMAPRWGLTPWQVLK